MAQILYAVSGEGYGHATRAHSVGAGLLARGHQLRFLSSNRTRGYLRRYFPDRVSDVFGLRTVYNEGRVQAFRTVMHNVSHAWGSLGPSNTALRRLLRKFQPDLVITDFEPFAAFWARRLGIPFVSLDNQHLLTHCELDHPPGFARALVHTYLTIRMFYGGAKRYLITTFIDVPIRYHPTTLVAPILRPAVYRKQARQGDFLLAYKGAGGRNDAMRRALESCDCMPVRAYGFSKSGTRGHVTFKPTDENEFLNDLASCAGVIATAGHSLVCECVHFEKPMLLLPVQQQYEQIINAYYVEKLGFGRSVSRLDAAAIDDFASCLELHRSAMAGIPKATIDPILNIIEQEIP